MMGNAIETSGLTKIFPGNVAALSGLDLAVPRGVVYGLIGRNGAGKTTAIRILMGLLHANAGSARVLGCDLWTASREQRQRIAYVPQAQQIHAWMTVGELCHYASFFYDKWDMPYAQDLARRFETPWDRQAGLMSGGQQRKVSILLALAARPDVLLLDEPAAGLDPIARRELVDAVVDVIARGDGCTVLFSTHIISDLERLAERVGVMDRGRMVMSERLEDLQTRTKRVQVIFDGVAPPADFRVPGAIRSKVEGPVVTAVARIESDTQLDAVRRIPGARVNVFPLGLEDAFIELFGPGSRAELTEETP